MKRTTEQHGTAKDNTRSGKDKRTAPRVSEGNASPLAHCRTGAGPTKSAPRRRLHGTVTYTVEGVGMPPMRRMAVTKWIRAVARSHGKDTGDIGYLFVNDETMLAMNKKYLHHDYYTDILTFDYDEGDTISGDIVISIDTVRSNSALFSTTLVDELRRVIIHGILHLCGINDKTSAERERMAEEETKALALWDRMCAEGI